MALIKHLVSVLPNSLEQKSSEGWTPLQIAVFTQREEVISYLVSIGANQRNRDKVGRNIMHIMVGRVANGGRKSSKKLQHMIELFDGEAVKDMFLERCTCAPGALTPLAYWMAKGSGTGYRSPAIIEVLSKYSTGEDLEMINGEGDLPLHVVRIS
jgi:ankyrin repeat protein